MASYHQDKKTRLWYVRFRDGEAQRKLSKNPITGEKFSTKKAAQYGYEDYIKSKDVAPEEPKEVGEMTVGQLYEKFLPYKKSRTKDTTHYDIERRLVTHVLPFFGDKAVSAVTPALVLDWMATLDGYSKNYKDTLLGSLGAMFIFGEKYFGIKNQIKAVDRPRETGAKKEMQVWSPEEFGRFISEVKNPTRSAFFMFAYFSGCRRGECLAIRWGDIDLDDGVAFIHRSFVKKYSGSTPYADTSTKTGQSRNVTLPSVLCEALKAYKHSLPESDQADDSLAFGGDRPIAFTTVQNELKRAIAAAGVKDIRLHDFRHSCASLLIHGGVSIVAVSHHLGHKTIKETLDTYAHMLPDDRTHIRSTINAAAKSVFEICSPNVPEK